MNYLHSRAQASSHSYHHYHYLVQAEQVAGLTISVGYSWDGRGRLAFYYGTKLG